MFERAAKAANALTGLLVQEMVSPVAELLVGGRVDSQFGPIVVVGGGGVLVGLDRDIAVRLAPVMEAMALEMMRETRAAALLDDWRGPRPGRHARGRPSGDRPVRVRE